ncbi:acetyltransferase, GNAT family protein [Formosa agariphila KMM 3901]|uniref:Acetyltransferase, GNAT family protein n=1 Tax=Formosa agariphila (strain DSM 15362 / KCTC 12365 / LMG 23005 / KMM 3901 / M-2Alg 35-1) TaxID=1347342 RepID=T2KPX5_FORAG|nr:GNAT family N-acetyltransferase [Formosa agariphila]CDF80511.1 acetyltransferase, GNAT family protein [Formosa agariphila KMM 3901]
MITENTHHDITVKTITTLDTYTVRQPILRPGRPLKDCEFINDNHADTFHLGLYKKSNLIGVVTFMKTNSDLFLEVNQYQLRGMAILEEFQGLQYGNLLIKNGETKIQSIQADLIWLNARETALKFYQRNGYKIIGEPFNIPKVGIHYTMYKQLN